MSEAPTTDVLDTGAAGGRAIRGGALRTAAYVVGLLMSLVAVPLMVRHLGVIDYGRFMTVSAIVFIIGGITEAGLTNLGVREYSVLRVGEREEYMRNLIGLRFVLTTVGVLLAGLITLITGAEEVIVVGTLVAGLGLLLSLVQQTYMIPLAAQLRLGSMTMLDLVKQGSLNGTYILFVVLGASLLPFFWASVIATLVMVTATLLLVRADAPLLPAFDRARWLAIMRETLPYALAAAVGLIYFRIALVLMSYVSSEEETGYFSAAFRIVEVVGVVPWLLVSAGFPILARAARDDARRLSYALQRMFEVATVGGTLLALALAVGAPFVIEVVAGRPEFDDSILVLRLQAVGLVTTFLLATWQFALLSLKLLRQLLVANTIAAVIAIGGTLMLAPPLGAEGAAIATVLAEAGLALACLIVLRGESAALRPRLGVLPKVAVAAAAAVTVAVALPTHPAVLAAAAAGVYLGTVWALGAIPSELLAALVRRDPGIK
jgi:O-antigen/teichoic acid export membrane protein